jgi:hypothetical protein
MKNYESNIMPPIISKYRTGNWCKRTKNYSFNKNWCHVYWLLDAFILISSIYYGMLAWYITSFHNQMYDKIIYINFFTKGPKILYI